MPVEQAPSPPRPAARQPEGAKLVRYHDYIDQKIDSTRRMVKVVDLATAFVELAVVLLAFLLLYAVVEHWVVPGGFSFVVRCALFGILVGGAGYFVSCRLWPLCVRAINPVYAAQTIEHGSPSLKNGLINLLLFRQRRTEIPDAVYRTLEEQAAHGLTRVQADTAVDQSQLIRLGYVLIAIVAVGALYKVLSPKDPFVAAERVLMPWAEIVPASRVSITAITPGAATISRGEFVDVAAEVRGLDEDDAVVLRYTTDDGQVVGRAIPMKAGAGRLQFSCRLADESDGSGSVGVTRSLSYRLEAGDARSLDYAITVVPAASILVERVEYDYPAYTGYVDRSVDGVGDIHAIEGTKITVHARANGPIREANVDLNADGRRDLTMTTAEMKAHAQFELELRDDRQTPRHASYVLRFTNEEGRANHDPVKHSIQVERDFEPEADVRVPEEKSRDVRLDENVAIEVAARDPDFALSAVRLRGQAASRFALDEQLLKSEHRGQLTAKFQFTPNAHGLKAGDVVEYWVEASDNRTPKPNVTATERKVLRIVSPNPAQQPPPDRIAQNDRQKRDQQPDQQQGEQGQGNKEKGRQGEQGGNAGQQQQGNEGGQDQGQQGQGQPGQGQQAQQNKGGGEQQGKESQPGGANAKSRPDGVGKNTEGNDQGDKEKGRQGEQGGQAGKQSRPNEQKGDQRDQQQKSDSEQTGAGAAGGESSRDGAQPAGTRPDENKGQKPSAGNEQNGEQQPKQGEDKAPVSSEGDNDAEAFDRIQKHLEQKGELKKDEASPAEEKNGGESQDKSQQGQGEQRQGDKETGRQGESGDKQQGNREQKGDEGAEAGSKDGKPGAEPKSADKGQQKGDDKQVNAKGGGAETSGDDLKNGEKPNGDQQGQQEKSPGAEQTASKGDPGAGEEKNSQGAPNSKPEMKPTEKPEQSPSKGDQSNQSEPPAGANSKKESDSHGEQGGDKAGGGEEGGGQKAPREGTGSAGQNQSADNGAGQSGEKGKGANSSEGGKDAKSSEKTGSSDGKTQGEGSQQREGIGKKADKESARQGDKEKGNEQGKQGANPGEQDKQAGKQGEKSNDRQPGSEGGKDSGKGRDEADSAAGGSGTEGGGKPGAVAQPSITGETPEGDAANLEYARKQTDLVVDKLADQLNKKKVDDKLLKDLGWSEAELQRFVERWQQRRDAANKNDPSAEAAKRELDDALRSLGLQRDKLQQGAVKRDTMRDLQQGYHGPVPAEYKDRLRAYNQGVSRARPDGE